MFDQPGAVAHRNSTLFLKLSGSQDSGLTLTNPMHPQSPLQVDPSKHLCPDIVKLYRHIEVNMSETLRIFRLATTTDAGPGQRAY